MSNFGWVVVKDAHFMKEAAPVTRFVEWNQCPTNVIWLYMVTWWPDVCWNVAVANRSHWRWYIIYPLLRLVKILIASYCRIQCECWTHGIDNYFIFFSSPTVESYQYESLLSFNTFSWTIVPWNITKALNKTVDLVRIYYEKKKYRKNMEVEKNVSSMQWPLNYPIQSSLKPTQNRFIFHTRKRNNNFSHFRHFVYQNSWKYLCK